MLRRLERRPRPAPDPHFRRRRRQPGEPPDRARRRPLLPRLRRRHHPPRHLHLDKPAADRGDHGEPDHRSRSADRQLQRHRLLRPGRSRRCTYTWDLDGDGTFGDSTAATASHTYSIANTYTASLRVTDNQGASDTDRSPSPSGNTPPTATIDAPAAGTTWKVGDVINFSGHATDPQQGTLPASALTWELILQHCPSNCHTHPLQDYRRRGERLIHRARPRVPLLPRAPTHGNGLGRADRHQDHPARPEDRDPDLQHRPGRPAPGRERHSEHRDLHQNRHPADPRTPCPPSHRRPRARRPTTSASWSDGGAQTHIITAPATNATYTARFR